MQRPTIAPMLDDPFAEFAFQPQKRPRCGAAPLPTAAASAHAARSAMQPKAQADEPSHNNAPKAASQPAASQPAKEPSKAMQGTASSATSMVAQATPSQPEPEAQEPPVAASSSSAQVTSAAGCSHFAEYALIAKYREHTRASVDDFHAFLLSLGTCAAGHGRFWALIACLLSVQCRDSVALEVTRVLMSRCGDAAGVLALSVDETEESVRRCNFFKTKAKNVRSAAEHTVRHNGRVPSTYDGLLALEGVGPKIAHLMRSVAFGQSDAGIVVDTHVHRVAARLGWVDAPTAAAGPEAVRSSLEAWVPLEERVAFSLNVVGFGQQARGGAGWGAAFVDHARRAADYETPTDAQQSSCLSLGLPDEQASPIAMQAATLAESMVARMDTAPAEDRQHQQKMPKMFGVVHATEAQA